MVNPAVVMAPAASRVGDDGASVSSHGLVCTVVVTSAERLPAASTASSPYDRAEPQPIPDNVTLGSGVEEILIPPE